MRLVCLEDQSWDAESSSWVQDLNNCTVCPYTKYNKAEGMRFQRPCSRLPKDSSVIKESQAGGITDRRQCLWGLTEFSMLRSMPSNKKAASVHTLWIDETIVPLEAGTPKIKVQMESKSNCRGKSESVLGTVNFSRQRPSQILKF